eukprot:TRINITY_DN1619_c0_g2_i1.p1 TRINITY_DN1619_c0_g2~~TRINITY_DN1619_c0_g2_i1.p1  ORF type:complete len:384 (+),score=37.08 TRINITY_DN1619_c0_g2_i1:76-1227(+)
MSPTEGTTSPTSQGEALTAASVSPVEQCSSDLTTSERQGFAMLTAGQLSAFVTLGVALGYAGHWLVHEAGIRAPAASMELASGIVNLQATGPVLADDRVYPPGFPVPGSGICGGARCTVGDLCCPGIFGYGNACGASDAVCCQGSRGSCVCSAGGVCCKNSGGAAYCCAAGNYCAAEVCIAGGTGECFAGSTLLQVAEKGTELLSNVQIGDRILTQVTDGLLEYEAVLSFIHEDPSAGGNYLLVTHSGGELHMSENHLIFVEGSYRHSVRANELRVGDQLRAATAAGSEGQAMPTTFVLSVRLVEGKSGMYAPLVASGNIVVGGVVASVYASASSSWTLSHTASHAAFFLCRSAAKLSSGSVQLNSIQRFVSHTYLAVRQLSM